MLPSPSGCTRGKKLTAQFFRTFYSSMDRLARRGWPNCNLCPLCKQVQETAAHLLFQCRFTVRVWTEIKTWLGLHDIDPQIGDSCPRWKFVRTWLLTKGATHAWFRSTLMMLVAWEIWNERNATVFRNTAAPTTVVIARLKMRPLFGLVRVRSICVILCREGEACNLADGLDSKNLLLIQ